MKYGIRPLTDRLLVEIIKGDAPVETSDGGLLLPKMRREIEPTFIGKVVEAGAGAFYKDGSRRPMLVRPGDTIVFTLCAMSVLKIAGKKFVVMSEQEVLSVLEVGDDE